MSAKLLLSGIEVSVSSHTLLSPIDCTIEESIAAKLLQKSIKQCSGRIFPVNDLYFLLITIEALNKKLPKCKMTLAGLGLNTEYLYLFILGYSFDFRDNTT